MAQASRDENRVTTLLAVSSADGTTPVVLWADPVTHRLLVDIASGGGTVTSVSVVTANGISGTVANATTTPAITLSLGNITPTGVNISGLTASQIVATDGSKNLQTLTTATYPSLTELSYVKGVTSSIQTQLDAKGTGTVTTVSVASANGFAGSVANATTTPAITISTTITGIIKGNGTAISAASAGTDYVAPGAITTSGLTMATARLLGRTTGSTGAVEEITVGSGLSLSAGTLTATGGVATSVEVGVTTVTSGTTTRVLYNNAGVLGEYTVSGSGNVAMTTSPTFVTPTLGAAIATTINGLTITSSTGTLTIANGKTATINNSITFAGTDSTTMTFPTTSATLARTDAGNTFTGASTASAWVLTSPTITTSIVPTTNDGAALGSTSNSFSDLFLASGAVLNFANGNSVITHSSAVLEVTTGDLRVTTAGTNSASVVTVGGTQTLTNKTFTSPTLTTPSAFTTGGTITLAENTTIALDPAGSADGKYTGITVTATAGYTQAFGDLVYLDPTDSRWEAADANSASGADGDARGLLGMVVVTGTDGNACTILLQGIIRADAKFPTFTVNNPIYVSETAGSVTQTQPTTTDVVIRIVGAALTADEMYFNPDNTWITHT